MQNILDACSASCAKTLGKPNNHCDNGGWSSVEPTYHQGPCDPSSYGPEYGGEVLWLDGVQSPERQVTCDLNSTGSLMFGAAVTKKLQNKGSNSAIEGDSAAENVSEIHLDVNTASGRPLGLSGALAVSSRPAARDGCADACRLLGTVRPSAGRRSTDLPLPARTTMPARTPQESTLQGTSVHRPVADADAVADMTPALALVWSQDEPARLGEVVCLPRAPVPFTIGRATEPGEDGALPLGLTRLRPFSREDTGPLRAGPVSRWQLRVRVLEDDELLVERIGRGELTLNGHPVERATAQTGDLIEVGGRFSLLVTRRATSWSSGEAWYPSFPFGEADAHGIVGESPAAWELRRRIAFVAPLREHTLVHGPTGAGKELVVAALHRLSPRAARPLIARGAATIPGPLIDAELFGNIRDYPAPGMPERPGLLGESDGGTLFLDDIGELPHAQQAHLLRVMDSGEYQRLGAPRSSAADLRILAATSRAPSELKHDLLARFAHRVRVPGLDERREDLPLLARHLLRRLTQSRPQAQGGELRLSAGLIAALMWHPFSVHVHELIELLWRAIAASPGLEVLAPPDAAEPPPLRSSESYTAPESLTREQVLAALAACDGVREQAWRMLGLRSRDQLKRLLKKLAI